MFANFFFFFFNDTATTEIYTLSLHDALPICGPDPWRIRIHEGIRGGALLPRREGDRKSTRLNSSHGYISYAVFCLKKKKERHDVDKVSGLRPVIAIEQKTTSKNPRSTVGTIT